MQCPPCLWPDWLCPGPAVPQNGVSPSSIQLADLRRIHSCVPSFFDNLSQMRAIDTSALIEIANLFVRIRRFSGRTALKWAACPLAPAR